MYDEVIMERRAWMELTANPNNWEYINKRVYARIHHVVRFHRHEMLMFDTACSYIWMPFFWWMSAPAFIASHSVVFCFFFTMSTAFGFDDNMLDAIPRRSLPVSNPHVKRQCGLKPRHGTVCWQSIPPGGPKRCTLTSANRWQVKMPAHGELMMKIKMKIFTTRTLKHTHTNPAVCDDQLWISFNCLRWRTQKKKQRREKVHDDMKPIRSAVLEAE